MATTKAGAPSAGLRLLTTKASILAAQHLAREIVPTPEWGEGTGVLVQALDVNRRLAWFEFISTRERNPQTGRREVEVDLFKPSDAALAALCIVDEEGEPVFSLAKIEELGSSDPQVIGRIAQMAMRLSGLGNAEVLGENLKAGNGASPSA